ncbi:hypothetical protein LXL04_027211 [Taraxacum kok-saghyz]
MSSEEASPSSSPSYSATTADCLFQSILRSSSWMPARGAHTHTSTVPPFLCLSLLPEKDQPHTPVLLGGETADVFRWLAGNSSDNLDIMAQYWQGIAQPNDTRSGDY